MMQLMRRAILAAALVTSVLAVSPAALAGPAPHAHIAKHKTHKKHKKHKKPSTTGGPSMTVLGFGMNHLYVASGTTVSNAADCSTMVQGNGYPYGPPQNIYVEAYIKATNIPASTPTQIGEDDPEDEEAPRIATASDTLMLSPAIPFSQAFDPSTLGFGTPPGSQKDIFRGGLFSENDPNGPSASDFNGVYSFEVSVDVNGTTLDSTATVTISCS
jgi:hypothetical protein